MLIKMVPRLVYYDSEEFSSRVGSIHIHWRHHLFEPLPQRTYLCCHYLCPTGLGAVGVGTGISSLVLSNSRYTELSATINQDLQCLQQGIIHLSDSLAEVVLQNGRELDLHFLQQGGHCAALKEECCFYISKTGVVRDSMKNVRQGLENHKRDREQKESWYENWFSTTPWLTNLLPSYPRTICRSIIVMFFWTMGF